MRDQRQAFEASLVLIEGKALSTRLIQDGLHAVIKLPAAEQTASFWLRGPNHYRS